ncbi:hypothetical protein L484_021118 [Morus notabilis]|uniref:Uncharacterized protein n=1 Tax=Morus notabilis TaxID=981085 RepID=W9R1G7_9ROSA|nr:hypothetical protein L484_021118 [Morus notabilis]
MTRKVLLRRGEVRKLVSVLGGRSGNHDGFVVEDQHNHEEKQKAIGVNEGGKSLRNKVFLFAVNFLERR